MNHSLLPEGKKFPCVYFVLMAVLFIMIEIAQLTASVFVIGLLKTIPAVLTACMGLRYLHENGLPKGRVRFLAAAVITVGIADILLCFFVCVVPILPQAAGVSVFCVMQILLMLWLGLNGKSLLLHAVTTAGMVSLGFLTGQTSLYVMIGLVNLGLLLGNLIQGIVKRIREKTLPARLYLYTAIGIAICDFSILARTELPSGFLQAAATEAAWIGYMPFLVFLYLTLCAAGNAGLPDDKNRKEP